MEWIDIWLSAEKVLFSFAIAATTSILLGLGIWLLNKLLTSYSIETGLASVATPIAGSFVFGLFALVFGLTMAASRTGAVGNIVPAALAFIGGLALWIVTKEKGNAWLVSACVIGFSTMFLFGTVLGSYERQRAIQQSELHKYDLRILKAKADAELRINVYRKSKGLRTVEIQ